MTLSETALRLKEMGLTLATAESCTGGLLSKLLTDVPGSSEYYSGGVISYSNKVKIDLLGVRPETLETCGAVSEDTAKEMALGLKKSFDANLAIAITGIAGPGGGTVEKPVGTVFIALSYMDEDTQVLPLHLKGTRAEIRAQSAEAALEMLLMRLKKQ